MDATPTASLFLRQATRFALSGFVLIATAVGQLTTDDSQFWHQDVAGIEGSSEATDFFGSALGTGDFNNDGYPDLAIGVPGESIGDITAAGVVSVLYGGEMGLGVFGNQVLSQDSPGVQGSPEESDQFGSSLAAGDFDGDGYDDLAVAAVGEEVSGEAGAGAVVIIPGGPGGLDGNDSQVFTQNTAGVEDDAEGGDECGAALAAGDFNHDGYADLAIGCPGEDLDEDDMGAVAVLYGSSTGLDVEGNQLWHQDSSGIDSIGEPGDRFGSALAVGDFNNDGYSDLAVGTPGDDVNDNPGAGVVNVLFGDMAGLSGDDSQVWAQGSAGMNDSAEDNDGFGSSLATGDFNSDGFDDLAVGVPGETVSGQVAAGALSVIYGASGGLLSAGNQFWTQGSLSSGFSEFEDRFGTSLSTGDFDNDGFDDLAAGTPLENADGLSPVVDAGVVTVLYGRPGGLTDAENQVFHQDTSGIDGIAEEGDRFGKSVAAADFDLDGFADLAVGVGADTVGDIPGAGSVHVLPGGRPSDLSDDLERQVRALTALQRLLSLLLTLLP